MGKGCSSRPVSLSAVGKSLLRIFTVFEVFIFAFQPIVALSSFALFWVVGRMLKFKFQAETNVKRPLPFKLFLQAEVWSEK